MTFRFRNKRCEGDHHADKTSFKSRHVDKALLKVAFDNVPVYGGVPRKGNHPMRYWAAAGWGPVPAVLRAPEGIYRELELVNPSDLDQTIKLSDEVVFWFEKHHHQNIIFYNNFNEIKLGEVKWVAVIDVRDNTTVENFKTPPQGSDALVYSPEVLEALRPPVDKATGREYIEMSSGEFFVRDFLTSISSTEVVVRAGNTAVGKWFWQHHPRRHGSSLSQLVVWHESVDDTAEYKTPYDGPDNELIEMSEASESCCYQSAFEFVVKERKEALAVVEMFLWTADAEPQLKHAMVQFMTKDPNGLWWKRRELPDGFLLSLYTSKYSPGKFVGELRCEKKCFVDVKSSLFPHPVGAASAQTIMGGCALRTVWNTEKLLSIQFKPSGATGKIVAMRAVIEVEFFG